MTNQDVGATDDNDRDISPVPSDVAQIQQGATNAMTPEPTKMRLARVLREHGLHNLAEQAEFGRYDDYESESATPIVDLVHDLRARGFKGLAKRAINGEFDGTTEESTAWYEREGKRLLEGKR